MDKTLRLGTTRDGDVFVKVKYGDGKLSMSGVIGPMRNGDAKGSCGQIDMSLREQGPEYFTAYAPGWSPALVARFLDVWAAWHLNDMQAGCVHQRGAWNTQESIEVVSYGLTSEAYQLREKATRQAALAHVRGETCELTETARALVALTDWFAPKPAPPDADSPLSGCYEVKTRETKAAGWVYPREHPRGLLGRPCEVCGYRYGSAWLKEEVPAEVLAFLESLPETDKTPAWV